MDNNVKKRRRRPVLAIISIICTALALALIILGLICILKISQIDNNWGYIILGLFFLIAPGFILGIIAAILALVSLLRREKLAISIVSMAISVPITALTIVGIIMGL